MWICADGWISIGKSNNCCLDRVYNTNVHSYCKCVFGWSLLWTYNAICNVARQAHLLNAYFIRVHSTGYIMEQCQMCAFMCMNTDVVRVVGTSGGGPRLMDCYHTQLYIFAEWMRWLCVLCDVYLAMAFDRCFNCVWRWIQIRLCPLWGS